MSPHLNHLWATTCPEEPSWRPGENRSPGWNINPALRLPKTGFGNIDDTINVPMYPRDRVHPICVQAVRGQVTLPDTVTWQGAKGEVVVDAEALITGEAMRDIMMHQVLETKSHPEMTFVLDSLSGVTRVGNAWVGSAFGTFTARGVSQPVTAGVKAFHDPSGMRVLVKWHVPATDLLQAFAPRLKHLGMGASTNLWHDCFMGADLVFTSDGMASR